MAMIHRISLSIFLATVAACPRPSEPKDPNEPGPAEEGETGEQPTTTTKAALAERTTS